MGGYSINNRVVFMHDNANTSGIYNDVNNDWMVKCLNGSEVALFHNGTQKMQTFASGISIDGVYRTSASAGEYSGNPRSLTIGFSGGNYGQIGYGWTPTTTSGVHTSALNDIQSRMDFYDGIVVYSSNNTSVSSGSTVSWTQILDARSGTFTYKGNNIWHAGNDGSGSGLDADTVDGLDVHTGRNNEANKIVRTQGNGYLNTGWINTTSGARTTQAITRVYASDDAYIRYYSLANFGDQIASHINYNSLENLPTIPTSQQITATSLSSSNDLGSGTASAVGNGWYKWGSSTPSNAPDNYAIMYELNDGGQPQQWVMAYGGSVNSVDLYGRRRTSGTWDTTWTKFWNTSNDGTGSGLDADTVDGIEGASTLHKLNNTGYYRPNTWIDFRDASGSGLYWGAGTGSGWHIHPTSTNKNEV